MFLRYLGERKAPVKSVTAADLEQYLRWQRRAYQARHRRDPRDENDWRSYYTAPIHHLLRVALGRWPPAAPFAKHLDGLRDKLHSAGSSQRTVQISFYDARRFLLYLAERNVSPEQASVVSKN